MLIFRRHLNYIMGMTQWATIISALEENGDSSIDLKWTLTQRSFSIQWHLMIVTIWHFLDTTEHVATKQIRQKLFRRLKHLENNPYETKSCLSPSKTIQAQTGSCRSETSGRRWRIKSTPTFQSLVQTFSIWQDDNPDRFILVTESLCWIT